MYLACLNPVVMHLALLSPPANDVQPSPYSTTSSRVSHGLQPWEMGRSSGPASPVLACAPLFAQRVLHAAMTFQGACLRLSLPQPLSTRAGPKADPSRLVEGNTFVNVPRSDVSAFRPVAPAMPKAPRILTPQEQRRRQHNEQLAADGRVRAC